MLGGMNQQIRQGIPIRPDRAALILDRHRSLVHGLTCLALNSGHRARAAELLQSEWPNDRQAEWVVKAAVSPTSTSSYPAITTTGVLQSLSPASASAQLFDRCLRVDLQGVLKVRIPYVVTAPVPIFIAEAAAAPVASLNIAGVDVGPVKKILIQVALTNELDDATPQTASAMIGKTLADAVEKSIDGVVFDAIAGDAIRPPGLLYNVTPNTPTAAGSPDIDTALTDIGGLAADIAAAGISPQDMIVVAAWPQAVKLQGLVGSNFKNLILGTKALADGTVVGIAPAGIALGYSGSPEIEVTENGVVHMEDSSPLQIGTPGAPPTVASPTRSSWQTNTKIIKIRARAAWGALPGSVQVMTAVNW
jgi:hypothetical protein